MPQPCTPHAQRGLSLLDALAAWAALSLGALALLQLQPRLALQAELARQRSEAVRLAQQDIERQRGLDISALTASALDLGGADPASPRYTLQRRIDAGPATGLQALSVTVRWRARDGSAQEVRLATLLDALDPALSGTLLLAPP